MAAAGSPIEESSARDRVSIERSLGGGVACRFAVDVRLMETGGRKTPHVLALVCDSGSKRDYCLFFYRNRKFRSKGSPCVPIFADFRYFVKDVLCLSLGSISLNLEYTVEAPNRLVLNAVVSDLSKVCQIATTQGFRLGGSSHSWAKKFFVNGSPDGVDRAVSPRKQSTIAVGPVTDSASAEPDVRRRMSKSVGADSSKSGRLSINQVAPDPTRLVGGTLMFEDIKQEWIQKQMKARTKEFSETVITKVFCGTYNVGTEEAAPDLTPWIVPDGADSSVLPDVIALAFQEIDMSAEAVLLNDTSKGKGWEDAISAVVSKLPVPYTFVLSKQLVGILLCVYVKAEWEKSVHDVAAAEVGCGLMGKMGNKGAVGIRLSLFDSTLCFLSAHFASGQDLCERRNQDYRDVSRRLQFGGSHGQDAILDHDYVFYLGDFNYRINLTSEEVKRLIAQKNWDALYRYDQLQLERKKGNVFEGFEEAVIRFAPTYKFNPDSQVYDTSEKKRIPAFCDRILWKGVTHAVCLAYRTIPDMTWSDHRPVYAMFRCPLQSIVEEKKHNAYSSIVRELDRLENECIPDAAVSQHTFTFPDMRFFVRSSQNFVLENIGQVLVQWRFIPKLNEQRICKDWLRINPTMGILLPGEESRIELTVYVDNRTVSQLNRGEDTIDDIVILHLENGKDQFLAVGGNYLRSCFGCSIEDLVVCPSPVRALSSFPPVTPMSSPLPVPRELWRVIDFIFRNEAMESDRLFRVRGLEEELQLIRDCLDTGEPFSRSLSVHSMSMILVEILDGFTEPVVPNPFSLRLIEHAQNGAQLRADLVRDASFPACHRNAFIYLIHFLREILRKNTGNRSELIETIVMVFSAVIFRTGARVGGRATATKDPGYCKKQAMIVQYFLTDSQDLV